MALDQILLISLKALEPYLDDMVIAGGWVPYLFAAHEQPSAEAVALKTRDLDVAVPRQEPEREKSIDQLLGEAGFTCEFRSLETPPVTTYVAMRAGHEIEIAFITNAKGPGQAVRSVQSGLTAQELRYVDLLLANKWFLPLDVLSDGELEGRVWLPTPAAFIFHKALVSRKRTDPLKREKDLHYIFYVLDGFRAWRAWVRAELPRLAAASPTWFRRCLHDLATTFETPASPGIAALLHERPSRAYPVMDDDQFRQYAWSVMQGLLVMMREGRSSRALRQA